MKNHDYSVRRGHSRATYGERAELSSTTGKRETIPGDAAGDNKRFEPAPALFLGGSATQNIPLIVFRCCCCCWWCCCCTRGYSDNMLCPVANSVFTDRGCIVYDEAAHRSSPLALIHKQRCLVSYYLSTGKILLSVVIFDTPLSAPRLQLAGLPSHNCSRNNLCTFGTAWYSGGRGGGGIGGGGSGGDFDQ